MNDATFDHVSLSNSLPGGAHNLGTLRFQTCQASSVAVIGVGELAATDAYPMYEGSSVSSEKNMVVGCLLQNYRIFIFTGQFTSSVEFINKIRHLSCRNSLRC